MKRIIVSFVLIAVVFLAKPASGSNPYLDRSSELPESVGNSTVVEAEHYDRGFEDDAFHDSTPENEGGELRLEGVDVFKKEKGDYYIGAITAGEWMVYSIKNPIEGNFDIELRMSSAFEAASVIVEVGTFKLTLPVPYSGSWDSWRQTTIFNVKMSKGMFLFKLSTDTGNFFIDSIRFIRRPS